MKTELENSVRLFVAFCLTYFCAWQEVITSIRCYKISVFLDYRKKFLTPDLLPVLYMTVISYSFQNLVVRSVISYQSICEKAQMNLADVCQFAGRVAKVPHRNQYFRCTWNRGKELFLHSLENTSSYILRSGSTYLELTSSKDLKTLQRMNNFWWKDNFMNGQSCHNNL